MFKVLSQLFDKTTQQKKKLMRQEYAYLFDSPPPNEWVCVDLEMTGLNPKIHHILSVGAVKIYQDHQQLTVDTGNGLSLTCRPPVMPTQESIVIHGLRPIDIENGIDYELMVSQLLAFIGNRPIVGFCTSMDIGFLNELVHPFLGINLPNACVDVSLVEQQLRQKQTKNPDIIVERRHLNELLLNYAIPLLPAHDAFNDAVMTAMLFCALQSSKHPAN